MTLGTKGTLSKQQIVYSLFIHAQILIDYLLYFRHCAMLTKATKTVKNPPAMLEAQAQPGWGRSPGEENGYPLQYSCLEKPMVGLPRVGHK